MGEEQREREDKYDASTDFVVPSLSVAAAVAVESATYRLDATYYDTSAGHLRRRRITVRRRRGGYDAGWHVKLPAGEARTEIRIDSRASGVPREISDLLLGQGMGHQLSPVAKISTTRTSHRLFDGQQRLLAEVADDVVRASRLSEPDVVDQWREVEVELGPAGGEALLSELGQRLVDAGATASASPSKLTRVMGPMPTRVRPRRLGGLVDDYLQVQYDAILDGDLGLRREENLVHPTRVAIRRLRSTIRVFGDLFDADQTARLDSELVWYAGVLGAVRDLDILQTRLAHLVSELPGDVVPASLPQELQAHLATQRAAAAASLDAALHSRRYRRLLMLLDRWREAPAFTDAAMQKGAGARRYLDAARKKLRKRLRAASVPGAPDELLHRARKAGKRLRYAAELAEPALGARATKTIAKAKELQTLLGEHQDAVMGAALLKQLGAVDGASAGPVTFAYGTMLAREWQYADETRAAVVSRHV